MKNSISDQGGVLQFVRVKNLSAQTQNTEQGMRHRGINRDPNAPIVFVTLPLAEEGDIPQIRRENPQSLLLAAGSNSGRVGDNKKDKRGEAGDMDGKKAKNMGLRVA